MAIKQLFFSILFCSFLFHCTLFYSFLFFLCYSFLLSSILICSILFCFILLSSNCNLFYSIVFFYFLFDSIVFYSILNSSTLFYSILSFCLSGPEAEVWAAWGGSKLPDSVATCSLVPDLQIHSGKQRQHGFCDEASIRGWVLRDGPAQPPAYRAAPPPASLPSSLHLPLSSSNSRSFLQSSVII